jgi:perosamine synthetase
MTSSEIRVPLTEVRIDQETEELVLATLRSGQLAQGPMVARFEAECAAMAGANHAVAVNNGTTALILALQAGGIGPGDEVITTPFTFAATLNAIVHVGATAVFADIGPDMNIDPAAIEERINSRTRAVMPVHLFGLPADMDAIDKIAERSSLLVVEDAAQAHGAMVGDRPVGTSGLATFSFYATKNITCGEGGVITTNDDSFADRMRLLRNQGMRVRYQYEEPGFNYRMTDVTAAIAMTQFRRRGETDAARRRHAGVLSAGLADVEGLGLPVEPLGRRSVWHQYTIRVANGRRDEVARRLIAAGIGVGVYYPRASYDYECYRSHPLVRIDRCPAAEAAASEVLSLPVHQYLTAPMLDDVIAAVREAMR